MKNRTDILHEEEIVEYEDEERDEIHYSRKLIY